ncbi:hypothetical protein [Paenibacillus sp. GbtcB18]|uniref:hypothetical protein n=1 Tax=Paenibacillus sp. GbtcB18 TaxID=2824763 RepID=UPI001C2FC6B9|nr:hypothetical protein [Paenibacillus sp. GbtcB18]
MLFLGATMFLKDQVATIIKQRFKLPDTLDSLIQSYILETGIHIVNYLGIDSIEDIPNALQFVWANLAMSVFKAEQSHLPELDELFSQDIDLKIGDTAIKEAAKGGSAAAVMAYANDLNRYRKLRW